MVSTEVTGTLGSSSLDFSGSCLVSSATNKGAAYGEGGRPIAAGIACRSGDEDDDDGRNSTLVAFFLFGCGASFGPLRFTL